MSRQMPLTNLLFTRATEETPKALLDTAYERVRQVAKWGVQTRPDGTGPEFYFWREAAQQRTDARAADGTVEWLDILMEEVAEAACEIDQTTLREELIQVAAVALSWVEDIDRKAAKEVQALRDLVAETEALGIYDQPGALNEAEEGPR